MKNFLTIILKFTTPMIFIISFIFWFYGQPPKKHSNSVSLNSKINFIKQKYANANLDVLSFGSSMNLNNLNSEVIVENYGKKYLNISSWGQNMEETYNLMKIFIPYYKPKFVFISSNISDFNKSNKNINYSSIRDYVYNKNFNTNFNPLNFESLDFYRNSNYRKNSYESLNFDKYGGVNYRAEDFRIRKNRWDGNEIKEIKLTQYKYLDSIVNYCNLNHIKLIYSQSPFRYGFISKIKPTEKVIINYHTIKLDSILNKKNVFLINSLNVTWPDSLFVDANHLNNKGSIIYTRFIVNNLKSL